MYVDCNKIRTRTFRRSKLPGIQLVRFDCITSQMSTLVEHELIFVCSRKWCSLVEHELIFVCSRKWCSKMVLENVLFVNFLWPVTMTAYTSINTENTVGVSLTLT